VRPLTLALLAGVLVSGCVRTDRPDELELTYYYLRF